MALTTENKLPTSPTNPAENPTVEKGGFLEQYKVPVAIGAIGIVILGYMYLKGK